MHESTNFNLSHQLEKQLLFHTNLFEMLAINLSYSILLIWIPTKNYTSWSRQLIKIGSNQVIFIDW